ncbi:hypothetical protein KFU94_42550 [Chloroflexi bacterium TSY]|nr:hypothetical protein [Chloroflexi bacterium TSY]
MKFKQVTLVVLLTLCFALTACEGVEPMLEAELKADVMEEILSSEFSSATDQFSLRYPADWAAEEDMEGGVLVIANSEMALARFNAGEAEPGDVVLHIGFLPAEFFAAFDVPVGTTPKDTLQAMMPVLKIAGHHANDTADDATVSEIEVVALDDTREAALVMVSANQREGGFMVSEVAKGITAIISIVTAPGEFETMSDILLAVTATIEFKGTSEVLWQAMLGAE